MPYIQFLMPRLNLYLTKLDLSLPLTYRVATMDRTHHASVSGPGSRLWHRPLYRVRPFTQA